MINTSKRLVNHLTPNRPDCPLFQIRHALVRFSDLISALPRRDRSYSSDFCHLFHLVSTAELHPDTSDGMAYSGPSTGTETISSPRSEAMPSAPPFGATWSSTGL